jgi:hypothetical protein
MKSVGRNVENDIFNPKRNDVLAGKKKNVTTFYTPAAAGATSSGQHLKRETAGAKRVCVTCARIIEKRKKITFFFFFFQMS